MTTRRTLAAAAMALVATLGATANGYGPAASAPPTLDHLTTGQQAASVKAPTGHSSATARAHTARRLVSGFYDTFNDGRLDRLDHVLDENWVDTPLAPGQEPGREGFKPTVEYFRSVFPDLQVTVRATIVSRDSRFVTVRTTFSGTQNREFLGLPATGRHVTFRTTDIHQIDERRIVRSWHLEDTFGAFTQIRAAQPPTG